MFQRNSSQVTRNCARSWEKSSDSDAMLIFSEQARIISGRRILMSWSAFTQLRKIGSPNLCFFNQAIVKLVKMPHCTVPMRSNGWRKTKGTDLTYHKLSRPLILLRNIRRDITRANQVPRSSAVLTSHSNASIQQPYLILVCSDNQFAQ